MKEDDQNISKVTEPELGNNATDYAAILIKNLVASGVPIVLPMFTFMASYLGDMIINVIPNQRLDRVVNFVQMQSEKLDALDDNLKGKIQKTMLDPETVPFVEKVLKMVVESETEQKRKYLASVLNNGLLTDLASSHRSYLLQIIDELGDLEILRLYAATLEDKDYDDFWDKHEETFYFEAEWDDDDEADRREMLSKMPTANLVKLGLLDAYNIDAKITKLGKEILRFVSAKENTEI